MRLHAATLNRSNHGWSTISKVILEIGKTQHQQSNITPGTETISSTLTAAFAI
jgi:hypothetical protein